MDAIPNNVLIISLFLLIACACYFSASETSMMALNPYRLRHLASKGHRGAKRVKKLLTRVDRLLGVILIGNTVANLLASAIATIIATRLWGDLGLAITTFVLTFMVLIFGEIMPKTLAARYPERIAFTISLPLNFFLKLLYPLVWLTSSVSNGILALAGIRDSQTRTQSLSREELRSVVYESGPHISISHQKMLLGILDLEQASVEDIMIPKQELHGLNLEQDWQDTLEQLTTSQYNRLPVYHGSIDNIAGLLHQRTALNLLANNKLTETSLLETIQKPYFVPHGTSLHKQLHNFKISKQRCGFVVDEYGDIEGFITLEDLLEEIVGEFTTDIADNNKDIHPQADGSYLVDGSVTLRELNRVQSWKLPIDGPKTLSGLIIEHLETLPQANIGLEIDGYRIEIIKVTDNLIKTARIYPKP